MRRISQLTVLCLAAGVVSACNKLDQVITSPVIPTAGVRFINAVPDTGAAFGFDFRFVDLVENSSAFRQTFRDNPQTTPASFRRAARRWLSSNNGSRLPTIRCAGGRPDSPASAGAARQFFCCSGFSR